MVVRRQWGCCWIGRSELSEQDNTYCCKIVPVIIKVRMCPHLLCNWKEHYYKINLWIQGTKSRKVEDTTSSEFSLLPSRLEIRHLAMQRSYNQVSISEFILELPYRLDGGVLEQTHRHIRDFGGERCKGGCFRPGEKPFRRLATCAIPELEVEF